MDFHEQKELRALFQGSLKVDYLTVVITAAIPDATFVPGKTCIILDEIQDCPQARAALKFFKLDGRYDVICTGSLLGVNGYKSEEQQKDEESASVPVGFETIVDMYPMDFEEWLWANQIQQPVIVILVNIFLPCKLCTSFEARCLTFAKIAKNYKIKGYVRQKKLLS